MGKSGKMRAKLNGIVGMCLVFRSVYFVFLLKHLIVFCEILAFSEISWEVR